MRLGILGGTFDPVHRGHLALANAARDELGLDEVLFLPAGQPWRKAGRMIASNEHRLAMLRRALEGEAAFPVSTLELERAGPSYTADTLEALRDDRPEDELFFLVGEDALMDLPNWERPQRILELARLAVARRADSSPEALEEAERRLPGLGERVIWLRMSVLAVSATEIRERVRGGQPIGNLVPAAVEEYIRKQGLYRT
ncbi:MAG: nicotinate-nucleotide adenylyltransferase [Chloroflexi bacterium]|nr:nicotinate-nucleotide adenylyltransferase [Chloroflexota bacterium]